MLFKGVMLSSLSGSVDGATYSHNRGGPYVRERTIPIDPDSPEQQALRDTMAELATIWAVTLNTAQRDRWQLFANKNKHPNRIGEMRKISGRAEFFRANIIRGQMKAWLGEDIGYIVTPSTIGPSCVTSPSFSIVCSDPATAEFYMSWDDTEAWSTSGGSALLIYLSDPQTNVINWFRSPYTLASFAQTGYGGTRSFNLPAIAPIDAEKRVFWKARITMDDGRVSQPWMGRIDT